MLAGCCACVREFMCARACVCACKCMRKACVCMYDCAYVYGSVWMNVCAVLACFMRALALESRQIIVSLVGNCTHVRYVFACIKYVCGLLLKRQTIY